MPHSGGRILGDFTSPIGWFSLLDDSPKRSKSLSNHTHSNHSFDSGKTKIKISSIYVTRKFTFLIIQPEGCYISASWAMAW